MVSGNGISRTMIYLFQMIAQWETVGQAYALDLWKEMDQIESSEEFDPDSVRVFYVGPAAAIHFHFQDEIVAGRLGLL